MKLLTCYKSKLITSRIENCKSIILTMLFNNNNNNNNNNKYSGYFK